MIRLLLLIFGLTLYATSEGQSIIQKVGKSVDSLRSKNADTFLIYKKFCVGCVYYDTCNKEPSQYLFWRQGKQTFLKKFSYCEDFQQVAIKSDDPLLFYTINKQLIDTEEIKPPTYYEISKRKEKSDTLLLSQYADHSTFYDFHFIINENEYKMTIDAFNLETRNTSDDKTNIYYEHNNLTNTKKLIDLTGNAIENSNRHIQLKEK